MGRMSMRTGSFIVIVILVLSMPECAYAYIGPGMGAGTIGALLGIITSIFLALFAVIWYPIKRLFKIKRKKSKSSEQ